MFKQTQYADEIAEAMRREGLVKEAEDFSQASNLTYALECLDCAASLFDDIGMTKASELVTDVIAKFAKADK
jgi:hypothetical protein